MEVTADTVEQAKAVVVAEESTTMKQLSRLC